MTVTAAIKLRCLLLGRKAMTNLDRVLKSRDSTLPTMVCLVQAMIFPAVMYGWELYHKEGQGIDVSNLVLEKTLESPLDSKRSNQSTLTEINPEYSREGLMLKLKLQYFAHLLWKANSLEKTLMLGKTERRKGQQKMRWLDSIMN